MSAAIMPGRSDFGMGDHIERRVSAPPLSSIPRHSLPSLRGTSEHIISPGGVVPAVAINFPRAPTFDRQRTTRCVRIPKPAFKRTRRATPHDGQLPTTNEQDDHTEKGHDPGEEEPPRYIVLGIFNRVDGRPQERLVRIHNPEALFSTLFWNIVYMRGITGLFSLKDVKQFSIFTCNTATGTHTLIPLTPSSTETLHQFFTAYSSWFGWTNLFPLPLLHHYLLPKFLKTFIPPPSPQAAERLNTSWCTWLHEALNNASTDPCFSPTLPPTPASASTPSNPTAAIAGEDRGGRTTLHYSLSPTLSWSPTRITLIITFPIIISLIVGLVLNSRDWSDPGVIEMSWAVGTYIATSGGILAALMGVVGGIQRPGGER